MRIGIDASPLAMGLGGIRRYTQELIRALGRVDDRNEYVLYGRAAEGGEAESPPNISRRTSRYRLQSWVHLFHIAGANGHIDLFHGPNYTAPLQKSFPTVLTIHDLSVHLFPESHPRLRRLRHRLLPLLCRRSARIIADSYCTMNDLVRHYAIPADKIDVVYLAAADHFRPIRCIEDHKRVRESYDIPGSFVLFVGSVEPRKNLRLLIQSMAALNREGMAQRLVIAGEGEPDYLDQLRRAIVAEGLDPGRDVVMTGLVGDDDLPVLYSMCDLMVYPSMYEGFGLPPLEAMACGTPVLVPDNSCFGELYGDCSFRANLSRLDTMTDAIRLLLTDRGFREELIENGFKRARARSWEDTAEETLEVYRRAAS